MYDFLRPENECCVSTNGNANGTENVGMVSREIYFLLPYNNNLLLRYLNKMHAPVTISVQCTRKLNNDS